MLLLLTLTVLLVTHGTGQTVEQSKAVAHTSVAVKSQHCKSAEKAIVFYRKRVWHYQDALGENRNPTNYPERRKNACAYKRYVAHNWQSIAREYKKNYAKYLYHFAWWLWLPDKFQRVGHCETGNTAGATSAGNFNWNSGTYVSAFGILRGAYDQFARRLGIPPWNSGSTPREQYMVATAIQNQFGWSAWGCGSA